MMEPMNTKMKRISITHYVMPGSGTGKTGQIQRFLHILRQQMATQHAVVLANTTISLPVNTAPHRYTSASR